MANSIHEGWQLSYFNQPEYDVWKFYGKSSWIMAILKTMSISYVLLWKFYGNHRAKLAGFDDWKTMEKQTETYGHGMIDNLPSGKLTLSYGKSP